MIPDNALRQRLERIQHVLNNAADALDIIDMPAHKHQETALRRQAALALNIAHEAMNELSEKGAMQMDAINLEAEQPPEKSAEVQALIRAGYYDSEADYDEQKSKVPQQTIGSRVLTWLPPTPAAAPENGTDGKGKL